MEPSLLTSSLAPGILLPSLWKNGCKAIKMSILFQDPEVFSTSKCLLIFIYSHCPLGHHDAIWLQRQLGFALIIEFSFCLFNLTFSPPALSHDQTHQIQQPGQFPYASKLDVLAERTGKVWAGGCRVGSYAGLTPRRLEISPVCEQLSTLSCFLNYMM